MNILIIGKGGREHAMIEALLRSPTPPQIFAWPGSDAISARAEILNISSGGVLPAAAKCAGIDLCVIGEEKYLAEGLADRFISEEIRVFGPIQKSAMLESSKIFAKEFMRRHGIPTPDFSVARSAEEAQAAVRRLPVVLKYDGLAAGKGVSVCRTEQDVDAFVRRIFSERGFGDRPEVLVEECIEGKEISVICAVSDGKYQPFTPARDYKRLHARDLGPNTGGMGAVASNELISLEMNARIDEEIIRPVISGLGADRFDYRGFLYFGLMLTAAGPVVLEFNCRFGDPEAEAVFPLVQGDFARYLFDAAGGELDPSRLTFSPGWSVCVVLAGRDYPYRSNQGQAIVGLGMENGTEIYHSGTRKRVDGGYETHGGRILCVSAAARDRRAAVDLAYRRARKIWFEGMQYRSDIGITHFDEEIILNVTEPLEALA